MTIPEILFNGIPMWRKDPGALKDYQIDWTAFLGGDTILISSWEVPTGITKASDTKADTKTTIWLSGGTNGRKYRVTNTITTTGGLIEVRSIEIHVENQ